MHSRGGSMITYFPQLYEDELLYSVFARYRMQSGSLTYRSTAEELFVNPKVRPDIEFINQLKPEAVELLCRDKSIEEVILKHTMACYYARFLSKEKRDEALKAVFRMEGSYSNLFSIPKIKSKRKKHLRYCPVCVKADRARYGESYWHRKHQIYGIDICYKHGCELIESPVLNSGKASPDFIPAESVIAESEIRYENEQQQKFASYVSECMDREIPLENNVEIGRFLNSRLCGTKYMSKRGRQRNITVLNQDFMKVFRNCSEGITELWQIEKVLNGSRKSPLEIYQLSYFLGIPVEDLTNPYMPEKLPERHFDEAVTILISEGKTINQISRELQVSTRTIRLVCEREGIRSKKTKEKSALEKEAFDEKLKLERKFWLETIKKYPNTSYTKLCQMPDNQAHLQWLRRNDKLWTDEHWPKRIAHRTRKQDWTLMDSETLPLVKEAIEKLNGKDGQRPRRVTIAAVNNMLGFPDKRMELLPKCKEAILSKKESSAEYWARELIWAIHSLLETDSPINYKKIRDLTNMRRKYIDECYPYVCKVENKKVLEVIDSIK